MSRDHRYEVKTFQVSPSANKVSVLHVNDNQVDGQGELQLNDRQLTSVPKVQDRATQDLILNLPISPHSSNEFDTAEQSIHLQRYLQTQQVSEQQMHSVLHDDLPVVLGSLSENLTDTPVAIPTVHSRLQQKQRVPHGYHTPQPSFRTETDLDIEYVMYPPQHTPSQHTQFPQRPVHPTRHVVEMGFATRFTLVALCTILSIGLTYLLLTWITVSPVLPQ